MTGNIAYIGVQISALLVYSFLLCCFIGSEREQLVKQLRNFLLACVMWVGGSLFMRLQLFPGLKWWYHISLAGLVLLMGSLMDLTDSVMGCFTRRVSMRFYGIMLGLIAVNIATEAILAPPVAVENGGGIRYVYSVSLLLLVALVPMLFLITQFFVRVLRRWRQEPDSIDRLRLLVCGFAIILIGNMLVLYPNMTFPIDVAAGLVAAVLLVVMLYQRHLFVLSERMLCGAIYMLGGIVAFAPLLVSAALWADRAAGVAEDAFAAWLRGYAIAIGVWMLVVFVCVMALQTRYLNARERETRERISAFQNQLSLSLDVDRICDSLLQVLMALSGAPGALLVTFRDDGTTGKSHAVGTLRGKQISMASTPEFLGFVQNSEECFFARDSVKLQPFVFSSGMQKWLSAHRLGGIGCLESDSRLLGYVFLDETQPHRLTRGCEQQLSVVCYSAASALHNATLYQKLYEDSLTDDLTGLRNRKWALAEIEMLEHMNESFGLLYLDLDDFKLYNEIYSVAEGDVLLCWCAEILQRILPESTQLCRYAADEFLAFFPQTDVDAVYDYGVRALRALADETGRVQKHIHYVTMSGGVSACPQLAANAAQTLRQAEHAMTQAKAAGANRILVYNRHTDEKSTAAYEGVASTIYALTAAIDAKDSVTFRHVQKVSEYAVALAQAIGYSSENVEIIRQAALLHDIGKISIPESILKKTGRLTREEYEIMKQHVANSIDIIRYLPGMDYVIPAVVGHHERYDGKGYPRGIAGEDIPESARILAVADSFDAMTAARRYEKARPISYAVEELRRCRGTQFDPTLTDVFLSLIERGVIHVDSTPVLSADDSRA